MKEVQKKAIENAIRLLKGAGCNYAVVTPDGEKMGDLQLALPKLIKRRRKHNFVRTGYIPRIKNMVPNDIIEFDTTGMTKVERQAFRAAIASCAHATFGKNSHTSTIVGNKIQLLRI